MKYVVNDGCIGCGLCENTCSDVFSIGETGVAFAIEEEIPEEAISSALEAMANCPVEAIKEA